MTRKVDLPMQTRIASLTSIDPEKRTAELVWTTGAQVRRYDWFEGRSYMEELSLDDGAVDLGRLNSGAPLLDTHGTWRLTDVIGVVEKAWIANGEGRAVVRFSERAEVEPIFQDVRTGIIRNVSVGYSVRKYQKIERDGQTPIYRAIDWEPMELSLVPVGADAGAGVRSNENKYSCEVIEPAEPAIERKEPAMGDKTQVPAGQSTAEQDEAEQRKLNDIKEQARASEKQRQADIRAAVRAASLDEKVAQDLIDKDVTIDNARKVILDTLAERSKETAIRSNADIITVSDQTDVRRSLMSEAISHRANPKSKLSDGARQYRGMSLIEMARECIEVAGGKSRGLSKREIAVVAMNLDRDMMGRAGMMSTSDFTNILASTVNRTLRGAYELAPRTFVGWCRRSTVPDFRQVARNQLSEMTKFQQVNEGGEYKLLTFGDSAEKFSLAKLGGIISVTWETIINDDLNAFDRIPRSIGDEAAATESDIVYGVLTTNAAMSDSTALFHANHGNLAASGTAITDVSLGAARAAMRKQTGPQGRILNITPDFLIVGPDKEGEANKYTSAQFVAAKSADVNPKFNTQLEVVVEPRLTGNQWYMSTTPTRVDTIEYDYLEGEEGLFTEQRNGFEVDGLQIKARLVFAAKAIDWRGMYKNGGA